MARTRTRYQANPQAIRALFRDNRWDTLMARLTAEAEQVAIAASPRLTGRYIASFRSGADRAADGRPLGRLSNVAPYALTVELGGSNRVKHRPLGKGLDSLRQRL